MIIRELNLIGFGKFNNEIIDLEDGINIIYGNNEAGKTTIHNFINGMFYGFLKPYAKRTIYEDEHGRYEPWSNTKYSGAIKFLYDGKEYRIERIFTKGDESTQVFLDNTGEEITNSIDNGNSGRVLQPGFHFFGFNDAVYSNTISIKQLDSRTEDSLANEVRDKLVNVSTTLDDNLSIEKAIQELDRALKDIGSVRATTSVYGKIYERLGELNNHRKEILGFKEEYDKILELDTSLDEKLIDEEKNLEILEGKLKKVIAMEKNRVYNESKGLIEDIEKLENKLQEYRKYRDLSMEDYSKAIELSNHIRYIDERKDELIRELKGLEDKLKEFENIDAEGIDESEEIAADYLRYEELEEEKNKLFYNNNDNEIQFLKKDYDDNSKLKSKFNLMLSAAILLSIGSCILTYSTRIYWILLANIALIPSIIFFLSKVRRVRGLLIRIKSHIDEVEINNKTRKDRIDEIQKVQFSILEKYKVDSRLKLKMLNDRLQLKMYKNREKLEVQSENILRREEISNKLEELKDGKIIDQESLRKILKINLSRDLDEFKIGLKNKGIYEDISVEIKNKRTLLEKTLGGLTLEGLEDELRSYDLKEIEKSSELSSEELKKAIDTRKLVISDIRVEKRGIEERLNLLNGRISQLVEIDEEIKRKQEIMTELDDKRESIELARDTIENISKDIHRQFAPTINEKVGKIIENITGGKYRGVKIDDKLGMRIVDPITREIIGIDSLSGGTIDQLYFSLRFGIIDSIKNQRLPLILDDCFIQYDDNRLKNMIKFLVDESQRRQIILFTCHRRENEILKDMDVDFNLIEL
ncbi:ATP-binding protein [Tissierellaceae bacterium HCP3S3_D8]